MHKTLQPSAPIFKAEELNAIQLIYTSKSDPEKGVEGRRAKGGVEHSPLSISKPALSEVCSLLPPPFHFLFSGEKGKKKIPYIYSINLTS